MQRFFTTARRHLILILILAVSLLGGWVVFYATANGPWGFSDSVSYIASARGLLHGNGLGFFYPDGSFHWETHFPPFYSLCLALFGALGLDLVQTSRWLSLGLYALTIFGSGLLLQRFCSSRTLAVIGAVLVACFPTMLNMFSAAMSEPLFICLCVWGFFSLLLYFETRRPLWFVCAALILGLVPLTRYVGIGVPAVMALAVLIFEHAGWRARFTRASQFGLLSNFMVLAWFVWVRTQLDRSLGGRVIAVSPAGLLGAAKYVDAVLIKLLWSWLPFADALPALPGNLKYLLLILAVCLVAFLAHRARRKDLGTAGAWRAMLISGLFALAYLVTLLIACMLTTPRPDIDDRMLLPLYVAIVLALLCSFSILGAALTGRRRAWLRAAAVLALIPFAWSYLRDDIRLLPTLRGNVTMTSEAWRSAAIMQAIRALPPDSTLISSASAEILIWADRPSYDFVESVGSALIDATGPYGSDPANPVQAIFRKKGSILIVFNGVRPQISRRYGPKGDARLDSLLSGLDVAANFENGIFYTYPAGPKRVLPQ